MTAPCRTWAGGLTPDGYGYLYRARKKLRAHRVAWEEANGRPVPPGLVVGHVCHDLDLTCPGGPCAHRACVEPTHLQAMTNRENTQSGRSPDLMRRRFNNQTECKHGHSLEDAYLSTRKLKPDDRVVVTRRCRECSRIRNSSSYRSRLKEKTT